MALRGDQRKSLYLLAGAALLGMVALVVGIWPHPQKPISSGGGGVLYQGAEYRTVYLHDLGTDSYSPCIVYPVNAGVCGGASLGLVTIERPDGPILSLPCAENQACLYDPVTQRVRILNGLTTRFFAEHAGKDVTGPIQAALIHHP